MPAAASSSLPELERRRLRSLVDADMATAESLHADEYELITPGGACLSRAEYLGGIARGELDYRVFEPASAVRVVELASGAAAVRYHARIEIAFGEEVERGVYWHTDLYTFRGGRWQVVWSHATSNRRISFDAASDSDGAPPG